MTNSYARWAASPIDEHLLVEDAGLTLTSNATTTRIGMARSDIAQAVGTVSYTHLTLPTILRV